MTPIRGSVVLVTGGGRGIGAALVDEVLERGAAKVYATARDPSRLTRPDVTPVSLELTDPKSIEAAAALTGDVSILINNAGIGLGSAFVTSSVEDIRREFEVNFFGPLLASRAWVPLIKSNGGGGHILNINSVFSWLHWAGAYSASKSALWCLTNGMRIELSELGIRVTGLHVGYVDTDMSRSSPFAKLRPADVAKVAVDGIEQNKTELLVDDVSIRAKKTLEQKPLTSLAAQDVSSFFN